MPKVVYEKGDVVSVRYGDSGRVLAVIEDGPHEFTSWEIKQMMAAKEKRGHSTKRLPKTYYRAKVGEKTIRAPGGHIIRAEAAPEAPAEG